MTQSKRKTDEGPHMLNRFEDYLFWIVTSAVGAVGGFFFALISKVFTSEKKVALLEAYLGHLQDDMAARETRRDKAREEDRERMASIEGRTENIETGISNLQRLLIGRNGSGE